MIDVQNGSGKSNPRQDNMQNGRQLAEDITALATRARIAGYKTTEFILRLAASELWKDIERENKVTTSDPTRNTL